MPTQMFKVTLRNKHLVSVFSGSGKTQTVRQEEREMLQVIGGLPHSTAMAYRSAQPDCLVEVDDSFTGYDSKQRTRVFDASARRDQPMRVKKAASPAPSPAPASSPLGGDYSTLVNKLAKRDAA